MLKVSKRNTRTRCLTLTKNTLEWRQLRHSVAFIWILNWKKVKEKWVISPKHLIQEPYTTSRGSSLCNIKQSFSAVNCKHKETRERSGRAPRSASPLIQEYINKIAYLNIDKNLLEHVNENGKQSSQNTQINNGCQKPATSKSELHIKTPNHWLFQQRAPCQMLTRPRICFIEQTCRYWLVKYLWHKLLRCLLYLYRYI